MTEHLQPAPNIRTLEPTAELYRLLVESVRDYAIFALDAGGRVVTWNLGAQRIKGYSAEEIIGRHFSVFYTTEDITGGKPPRELEIASRDGQYEEEGWRVRKDGTHFWANVVITALRDKKGRVVGFAKVTRDLTERRAAQLRELDDARRVAEAEAANRAKAEFLATMSHELRTPLNAIAGYVELLILGVHGTVTPEQRAHLERVRRSQQHLLAIVNDLLDYARAEAGRLTYEVRPFALAGTIATVTAMVAPQAEAKGVRLAAGAGASVIALGDPTKVEQILLNLLTNAVKFTAPGGEVRIHCAHDERMAELSVSDSGVGIAREKLDEIFEPFVQLGRSLSNPMEGTGLGLAISRDLARGMGGDVTAVSEPGRGSTFTLRLPLPGHEG